MLTDKDREAIPYTPEATTVIGDMTQLYWYIKSGRASRDWERKINGIKKDFDTFVTEHPHEWSSIVIPDRRVYPRGSPIMERLQEIFHS